MAKLEKKKNPTASQYTKKQITDHPRPGTGGRLTLRPLFIKPSSRQHLSLHNHINILLVVFLLPGSSSSSSPSRSTIDNEIKHLRTAIIPRISTERLPHTHHSTISRDIHAVRREDILRGSDIEEVGLGFGLGLEVTEDKGRGVGEWCGKRSTLFLALG